MRGYMRIASAVTEQPRLVACRRRPGRTSKPMPACIAAAAAQQPPPPPLPDDDPEAAYELLGQLAAQQLARYDIRRDVHRQPAALDALFRQPALSLTARAQAAQLEARRPRQQVPAPWHSMLHAAWCCWSPVQARRVLLLDGRGGTSAGGSPPAHGLGSPGCALADLHDSSNDRLDLAPGPASGCLAWQGRRQVHRLRVAVPARCCRRTGAWRGTHG